MKRRKTSCSICILSNTVCKYELLHIAIIKLYVKPQLTPALVQLLHAHTHTRKHTYIHSHTLSHRLRAPTGAPESPSSTALIIVHNLP